MSVTAAQQHSATSGSSGLCRVSIATPWTQADLAVPRNVPVSLLMPRIVEIVTSRVRRDPNSPDEVDVAQDWVLCRPGSAAFDGSSTLGTLGVVDGELLVFCALADSPDDPLFDDVFDAVAHAPRPQLSTGRRTALQRGAATAALIASCTFACVLLIMVGAHGESPTPGFVGTASGFIALLGALLCAGFYRDARAATALGIGSVLLTATGTGLLVPGGLPAPQLIAAFVAAAAMCAVLQRALPDVSVAVCAVGYASVLGAGGAAAVAFTSASPIQVGAGVIALGLWTISGASRLAMLFARLTLPQLPLPLPDLSAEPVGAQLGASWRLLRRASRAHDLVTALTVGAGAATVGGVALAAQTLTAGASISGWSGILLAATAAVVLLGRARTHDDVAQSAALLVSGGLCVTLIAARMAVALPESRLALIPVVAGVALLSFVTGFVAPRVQFSPVTRRISELAEYAAIATVVPLTLWVWDLYRLVRGI